MTDALLVLLIGAVINGLVTWGVIRARLESLADGLKEAKQSAARAHERIDDMMGARK